MQQDCGASAEAEGAEALSRVTRIWEMEAGDARKAPPGLVAALRAPGGSPDGAADIDLSAAWSASGVRAAGAPAAAGGADWIAAFGPHAAPAPFAADLIAAAPAAADAVMTDDLIRGAGGGAGWRLRLKPMFDSLLAERADYLGAAVFFRPAKIGPDAVASLAAGAAPATLLASRPELRVAHLPYPAVIDAAAAARASPPRETPDLVSPALVSVIIPNRDSPDLIAAVLEGVLGRTSSGDAFDIEVVVVDNGGESEATRAVYRKWRDDPRFRVDIRPAPFNFSAMVNRGAALARGDALLLLNNDIEVADPDWLLRMVETLAAPDVGVVGARLLFPDRTVQHMGVIVGHGGVAGHDRKGMAPNAEDPLGRTRFPHLREAVTAAAMLVRRDVWERVGGFDETAFPVAFNDVDFCLRADAAGWRTALDPRATLIHHEGVSRRGGLSMRRFLAHQRERAALRARHGAIGRVDRFESPWRDPDRLAPTFRMLSRIPEMRF